MFEIPIKNLGWEKSFNLRSDYHRLGRATTVAIFFNSELKLASSTGDPAFAGLLSNGFDALYVVEQNIIKVVSFLHSGFFMPYVGSEKLSHHYKLLHSEGRSSFSFEFLDPHYIQNYSYIFIRENLLQKIENSFLITIRKETEAKTPVAKDLSRGYENYPYNYPYVEYSRDLPKEYIEAVKAEMLKQSVAIKGKIRTPDKKSEDIF